MAAAKEAASERSEASHANGASRRSGSRESGLGSPRGETPRSKYANHRDRTATGIACNLYSGREPFWLLFLFQGVIVIGTTLALRNMGNQR